MSIRNVVRGLICFALLAAASPATAQGLVWKPNLSQGFLAAAEGDKPLVMVFAKECGPNCACTRFLKQGTLEHKAMERYAKLAIFVHANPDHDDSFGNVKQKMAELGVNSFPTVVILKIQDNQLIEKGRVEGRWDTPYWLLRFSTAFAPLEGPQPAGNLTLDAVSGRMAELGFTPIVRSERTLRYHFPNGLVTVEFDASGETFLLQTAVVDDIHPGLNVESLAKATNFPAEWFHIGTDRVDIVVTIRTDRANPPAFVTALTEFLVGRAGAVEAIKAAAKTP